VLRSSNPLHRCSAATNDLPLQPLPSSRLLWSSQPSGTARRRTPCRCRPIGWWPAGEDQPPRAPYRRPDEPPCTPCRRRMRMVLSAAPRHAVARREGCCPAPHAMPSWEQRPAAHGSSAICHSYRCQRPTTTKGKTAWPPSRLLRHDQRQDCMASFTASSRTAYSLYGTYLPSLSETLLCREEGVDLMIPRRSHLCLCKIHFLSSLQGVR
jgi:hypothetical protein